MQNLVLKQNDLVKYSHESDDLYLLGYVVGRLYKVMQDANGLYVRPVKTASIVYLTTPDGELTDACDFFAIFVPKVDLPIGQVS